MGQQQEREAALTRYASNDGRALFIGVVRSLIGLVGGVMNLANAVDYLARREHTRSAIDSMEPAA